MLDSINAEQELFGKKDLEWQDTWFNIANKVAQEQANGNDVQSNSALAQLKTDMNSAMESLD